MANAINGYFDDVTVTKVSRRSHPHANASRCPCSDYIAGIQGYTARAGLDQNCDVKDQIARPCVLAEFVVDPTTNPRVGGIQLILRNDPRTHGAKSVE